MRTVIFLVLLLQTLSAQQDSLRQIYLNRTASELNNPIQNTEKFFSRFFDEGNNTIPAAANIIDTSEIFYFVIKFSSPLEYNFNSGSLNINFNYLIEDKECNNSNRNGIVLLEKTDRIPPKGKDTEKVNKAVYVIIPDKCSTTRFYNAAGIMFCDNKKQFVLDHSTGKNIAEKMTIRIGIQLLPESRGNFYEKNFPPQKDYPVDTSLKEYVLRCCIRSITFLNGSEVLDNYVSIK
jgi:hypothetical protein